MLRDSIASKLTSLPPSQTSPIPAKRHPENNPRSKHWNLIDYILVRQRYLKDVLHTRVMPSAQCHTVHSLVCCKVSFHFKPKPKRGGASRKKLSVGSLQSAEVKADFQASLQARIEEVRCSCNPSSEEIFHMKETPFYQSLNRSSSSLKRRTETGLMTTTR